MGCFVQGEKSVWDLLSTPPIQCGMFCPPWRSSVDLLSTLQKMAWELLSMGSFVWLPESSQVCILEVPVKKYPRFI